MTITRGEIGGIQMAYNTPFTPRPSTSELARYFLAQTGWRPMLPYALDIWDGSQKKLAVSWGHVDGDLELMTLKSYGRHTSAERSAMSQPLRKVSRRLRPRVMVFGPAGL